MNESIPLLDHRVANPRPMWEAAVNQQVLPYLNDHQVDGLVVLPGAAYVEAGLAAFHQITGDARWTMSAQLQFHHALMLTATGADHIVDVELDQASGEYGFYSRESAEQLNSATQCVWKHLCDFGDGTVGRFI